jgi:peptidoglycan/LPS O-acetylase OafA/YrhL
MRLKQLDALRALAVILVLGHHVTWNPLWVRFGWSGVDLFFVLSGFLISGLLFREYKQYGGIHILRFWTRRALKIYPAYYLLIFVTVAGRMVAKTPVGWSHIWPDLIFVQSYLPGTWGHLWSLAVEEHFYILLPLMLWAMMRCQPGKPDPFRQFPLVCLIIAVACLALRSAHLLTGEPFNFQSHKFATHVRLDALSFGVLLSYYWEFRRGVIERLFNDGGRFVLTISLFLLVPAMLFDQKTPFMHTAGLSLLYLGYGGLLLYCLQCVNASGVVMRTLARVGVYSYTLYLCHLPVASWCVGDLTAWSPARAPVMGDHPFLLFLTYLGLTFVAGIMMAKLVEMPFLNLRDRLAPARKGIQMAAPVHHSDSNPGLLSAEEVGA